MRRRPQLLLQAISPDQGRRTVHFIKIPDLFWNIEVWRCIIQFLLRQLFAKNTGEFFLRNRLQSGWVQKGRRLFFHISPDIIPLPWHFMFFQVNFIWDFLIHAVFSLSFTLFLKSFPIIADCMGDVKAYLRINFTLPSMSAIIFVPI